MYIYKYIVKLSSEGGKNNKSTTKFESKPYKELSKQNQKGHSRLQNIVVPLGQDQAVVKSSSQNLLTLREVWVPKSCFQTTTWGRQIQFETCKQEKTGLSLHMFQVTCSCFFSLDFFKAWGGFFFLAMASSSKRDETADSCAELVKNLLTIWGRCVFLNERLLKLYPS